MMQLIADTYNVVHLGTFVVREAHYYVFMSIPISSHQTNHASQQLSHCMLSYIDSETVWAYHISFWNTKSHNNSEMQPKLIESDWNFSHWTSTTLHKWLSLISGLYKWKPNM